MNAQIHFIILHDEADAKSTEHIRRPQQQAFAHGTVQNAHAIVISVLKMLQPNILHTLHDVGAVHASFCSTTTLHRLIWRH